MFKDKLKDNRLRLGLSQEDLAQKIFVSRSAVAKWEQGRGIPEDDSLERLSELFGIPSDVLLSKEDMKQEVMNFGQLLVFFVLKMFIFFEKTEDFKKIFKNLNEQRKSRK